jgi:hypothetical protein
MTDARALDFGFARNIRAMLRGATRAHVLCGWYFYEWGDETFWVVTPASDRPSTYTTSEAGEYCEMLCEAGVEPVYRAR